MNLFFTFRDAVASFLSSNGSGPSHLLLTYLPTGKREPMKWGFRKNGVYMGEGRREERRQAGGSERDV